MEWSSLSDESAFFSTQSLRTNTQLLLLLMLLIVNQLAPGIKPEKEINATTTLHVDYNLNRGSFMYIVKISIKLPPSSEERNPIIFFYYYSRSFWIWSKWSKMPKASPSHLWHFRLLAPDLKRFWIIVKENDMICPFHWCRWYNFLKHRAISWWGWHFEHVNNSLYTFFYSNFCELCWDFQKEYVLSSLLFSALCW